MDVFSVAASNLFVGQATTSPGNSYLAQLNLARALGLYQKQDYQGAVRAFQVSIGYAPNDPKTVEAYNYMAQSYAQLGEVQKAIETFQQSVKIDQMRNDTYIALGKLYYKQGDYQAAQTAFEKAVVLSPDAASRYSLGQAYMANSRYSDAENQFALVRGLAPNEPNGDYGLGQVYAKEGKTRESISAYDRALALQGDFWNALADKGYELADNGRLAEAKAVVETLTDNQSSLATTLSAYVAQKTPPEMVAVISSSTFLSQLGPRTPIYALNSDLVAPNATATVSMVFQFSKQMDPASVQNPLNWSIGRSVGSGVGDGYNFNLAVPSTEVTLPQLPTAVVYNSDDGTATIYFQLQQNATGNATIDPSHVQFAFHGKDADGIAVNPKADQYMGFSGFA